MNILSIVLCSICIILNSIVLYDIHKLKKSTKPTKVQKQKNNIDYLYSLEFNTKLDGLIQPLLNKHSNKDIIDRVYDQSLKIAKDINPVELKSYIEDTMKNYTNKYVEQTEEIIPNDIPDMNYNFQKHIKEEPVQNNNSVNLPLKDFYK